MTTTQITGLIAALYADFTEKMAPALPPEQNYNAAMMKRGLVSADKGSVGWSERYAAGWQSKTGMLRSVRFW